MKKTFYILFAFYFLSLVALPCSDKEDCNETKHHTTQSHQSDHQDEACTPFCVCSCCASLFVIKNFQPIQNQVAVINTVYTAYPESRTSAAIISIWQPPKLS